MNESRNRDVTLIHGESCLEEKVPNEERLQIWPELAKIDGGMSRDGHRRHSRRLGLGGEQGDGEKRKKGSQPEPLLYGKPSTRKFPGQVWTGKFRVVGNFRVITRKFPGADTEIPDFQIGTCVQ